MGFLRDLVTTKAKIRAIDMAIIDKVFEMESGWVLNFVNRTFAEFFREELGVDIDNPYYAQHGGSKARRLRFFLRNADRSTALKTLNPLWEYREASSAIANYADLSDDIRDAFFKIKKRLGAEAPKHGDQTSRPSQRKIDLNIAVGLKTELIKISGLEPQLRGYAFEKFLREFFDAYSLSARASFRLLGEQIDGSFVLAEQTYLIEAKWTNALVSAATLRAFNSKVEDKAAWSRGLFISQNGFSEEGLSAFGAGRSIVCMDGLDLYEILEQQLDFADVLRLKVRRAAETGRVFIRLRDLNM